MKKYSMYILVNCKTARNGRACTRAYESFDELKEETIKILDGRGWDNKDKVDLRSVGSCLNYVLDGKFYDIKYKFSMCSSTFMDYRYGNKAVL